MRTFLVVLFIAFITLSLEIDTDKLSQSEPEVEKDFISRLAFWLPDEKTDAQKQKEQDDFLKNAETLDLSAIEKAAQAIEAQKEELVALDEKYKEIIEEPRQNELGAKELSQPFFEDDTLVVEQRKPVENTQGTIIENQESELATESELETIGAEVVDAEPKIVIEVEEVDYPQIGLEGYEVTKSPSYIITNFTLRNMVAQRHSGVFSFALILADGEKKYLEFSPATYSFMRIVAKNYEIPIPQELSSQASDAYGFLLEVKNQNNKLLLSRLYTF